MAPRPVSGADDHPGDGLEPSVDARLEELRAERDAERARADAAEQVAEDLAEELGAARAQLANASEPATFDLFDDAGSASIDPTRAPDGSEPGILPIALAAVGTVCLLVGLLSWANNGFFTIFTPLMIGIGTAFASAAWQTRVVRVEVTVVDGVVTIVRGDTTHSFDLRNTTTRFEVFGQPGDSDWRVRFYRRGLDPLDVDAQMVDPEAFVARLREYRPES